MLDGHQGREIHERFRELNALANSGALTPLERSELNAHLDSCEECREAALEYRILAAAGGRRNSRNCRRLHRPAGTGKLGRGSIPE